MNRKEYIDWLNKRIEETERDIFYFEKVNDNKNKSISEVTLQIFRICLNRFKGR